MSEDLKQVTPLQLKARLAEGTPLELIDVREAHEHEQFNIGGRLIPFDEILNEAHTISRDRDVILYCKIGIRSQIAMQRLQEKFNFTNLINLKGGVEAWKRTPS